VIPKGITGVIPKGITGVITEGITGVITEGITGVITEGRPAKYKTPDYAAHNRFTILPVTYKSTLLTWPVK
jgi:hypothetical protein